MPLCSQDPTYLGCHFYMSRGQLIGTLGDGRNRQKRRDGLEPVDFMHSGPVRHHIAVPATPMNCTLRPIRQRFKARIDYILRLS